MGSVDHLGPTPDITIQFGKLFCLRAVCTWLDLQNRLCRAVTHKWDLSDSVVPTFSLALLLATPFGQHQGLLCCWIIACFGASVWLFLTALLK